MGSTSAFNNGTNMNTFENAAYQKQNEAEYMTERKSTWSQKNAGKIRRTSTGKCSEPKVLSRVSSQVLSNVAIEEATN